MAKSKSKKSSPQSQALIKQKKHSASILRKLGLYSPNVPRITNETVRKSGALQRKLREFADVTSGKSKAIKVGKKAAAAYKREGYRAQGERVIVAVRPQTKVYARSGKIIRHVETAPVKKSSKGLDDCLDRLEEWYLLNADYALGNPEIRFKQVRDLAHKNPRLFFRIIGAYRDKGERYLNKQKQTNPRIPGYEVFEKYVEIFYYHPTTWESYSVGGIMPKC